MIWITGLVFFFLYKEVCAQLYPFNRIHDGSAKMSALDDEDHGPPYNLTNWGGNFAFSTQNIQYPRSEKHVISIVKSAKGKIRALGMRHSFVQIADSKDTIICMLQMSAVGNVTYNEETLDYSVKVGPGVTYAQLALQLEAQEFALASFAMPDISVGGATQTGTHSSGWGLRNFATYIRALRIVLADGSVRTYTRKDPELKAIALGLGVFGIITQIELDVQPAYEIVNHVFLNLPTESLYEYFDDLNNLVYSPNYFTDFGDLNTWNQAWMRVLAQKDTICNETLVKELHIVCQENLYGAQLTHKKVTPVSEMTVNYIVDQGVRMPFYGLAYSKLGLTGFRANLFATEYFIPYRNAKAAIQAVTEQMGAELHKEMFVALVRTIDADDMWMSQSYMERTITLDISYKPDHREKIMELIPKVEKILMQFEARPHWGKFHTMRPSYFLQFYPKLNEFRKLADELDPEKKFRNDWINCNIWMDPEAEKCHL